MSKHTEDCLDANDDTSVLKGKCICPKPENSSLDLTSQIIAYEQDDLSDDDTVKLFQNLVDSGLAWQLQGHYGRTAKALIDAGLVTQKASR